MTSFAITDRIKNYGQSFVCEFRQPVSLLQQLCANTSTSLERKQFISKRFKYLHKKSNTINYTVSFDKNYFVGLRNGK